MPQNLESIFLGHTKATYRVFIIQIIKHLLSINPNYKFLIPMCGVFTLAKCCIEAGVKAENIYTSDVTFISTLLGSLFSGKSIESINVDYSQVEKLKNFSREIEKTAYLLYLIKLFQFRDVYYEQIIFEEMVAREEHYVNQMLKKLEKAVPIYKGIHYEIADVRDVISNVTDNETVAIVDVPAYSKGYEKMYANIEATLKFNSGIEMFNFKKEFLNFYELSKSLQYPIIFQNHDYKRGSVAKENIIFLEEKKVGQSHGLIINNNEFIKGFKYISSAIVQPIKSVSCSYPILDETLELNEKTPVHIKKVDYPTAMYYRDLFAHKLGSTKAEIYILILLDKKVFGVVGLMSNELQRLVSDDLFENFGFNAYVKKYPTIHRLLMLILTYEEFKNNILPLLNHKNRIYNFVGLKTTCLAKYRTLKSNSGIFKVIKREKMKNGNYKILYRTDFHKRSYADCIKIYLEEFRTSKKINNLSEIEND